MFLCMTEVFRRHKDLCISAALSHSCRWWLWSWWERLSGNSTWLENHRRSDYLNNSTPSVFCFSVLNLQQVQIVQMAPFPMCEVNKGIVATMGAAGVRNLGCAHDWLPMMNSGWWIWDDECCIVSRWWIVSHLVSLHDVSYHWPRSSW